jgi:glycosyltransferase involved in cell wall biosynthesis
MNNPPLISIGMPVYDGEPFVKEALDSLLAQDYPNFELIISDNASTDGTSELCVEYAKSDSRIKYYRNSENLGAIANFNRVFALAKGKYFAWAAHDDVWEPAYFSTLARLLENNPDAVLAFSAFNSISEEGEELRRYPHLFDLPSDNLFQRLINYIEQEEYLGKANPICGLIRRELLEQTGGIKVWGKCELGSDMLMVFWLLSQGKLVLAEEILFHKRLVQARVGGQAAFSTISGQRLYFAGYGHIIPGIKSLSVGEKMRLRIITWRRLMRFWWNFTRDVSLRRLRNRINLHPRHLVWLSYSWVTQKPLLYRPLRALKRSFSSSQPQSGIKK